MRVEAGTGRARRPPTRCRRGDGQVHRASTALRRVHDLEVLDVDIALPQDAVSPPARRVVREPRPADGDTGAQLSAWPRDRAGRAFAASNVASTPRRARPSSGHRAAPAPALDVEVDAPRRPARGCEQVSLHRAGLRRGQPGEVTEPAGGQERTPVRPPPRCAARPIRAVEATCGRWLTNATSRSCRSGSIRRAGRRADRPSLRTASIAAGSDSVRRREDPDDPVDDARPRRVRGRRARCRPSGGPARIGPGGSTAPSPGTSPTTRLFTLPQRR